MNAAIDSNCPHCGSSAKELRQKRTATGGRLVAYQCTACGRSTSSWLKQSSIANVERLPAWDVELEDRRYEAFRQNLASERAAKSAEWWDRYTAYLRTPAWQSRRAAVMARARGYCEGCGKAQATQVHHLTYAHVTEEFLWELVAVCEPCHDKVHGIEPGSW